MTARVPDPDLTWPFPDLGLTCVRSNPGLTSPPCRSKPGTGRTHTLAGAWPPAHPHVFICRLDFDGCASLSWFLVSACATARVSCHLDSEDRAPGMWVCCPPSRAGALTGIRTSGHGPGGGRAATRLRGCVCAGPRFRLARRTCQTRIGTHSCQTRIGEGPGQIRIGNAGWSNPKREMTAHKKGKKARICCFLPAAFNWGFNQGFYLGLLASGF